MTEAAALKVDRLSVSYGGGVAAFRAVRDVSFRIAPGEAYGLIGESGSGKTTVAFALMQYLPGKTVVDSATPGGMDLMTQNRKLLAQLRGRRIGMVYQDPMNALNPMIRVGDQVMEVLRRHLGMSRSAARKRVVELFGQVQLPDPVAMLRRYPHQISGGQQQRVVIAMAIACKPELLIMDEPTTGLDVTTEAVVLDLIADLRREVGSSILFISHNLGVVARVCDRIGVLYAGELVEEGTTQDVLRRPSHPYTLALIEAIPTIRGPIGRLRAIQGHLPNLQGQLSGCIFADRCWLAEDRCRKVSPPIEELRPGHLSRCLLRERVSRRASEAEVRDERRGEAAAAVPRLELKGLSKAYHPDRLEAWLKGSKPVVAVDEVSLVIERSKTLALVGESGSGKSTLGRCVAGLTMADAGKILLDATEMSHKVDRRNPAQLRKVQVIFQNPDTSLNPRQTIGSILSRPLRLYSDRSAAQIRQRIAELLEMVKLSPDYAERYPGQLSGGQKQRVAIARAFAAEPDLIICDEPTSALDISVQAAILNQLKDLQRDFGTSYLFISHDLGVVRYLADSLIVMKRGKVVEAGPTSEVLADPRHPYTRELLAAVPEI